MNKKILSIIFVGMFMLAGFSVISAKENKSCTVNTADNVPDLDADGHLSFNVNYLDTPNSFEGSFTIRNIGDPGSKLVWAITSYPNWGSGWYFKPSSGNDLEPMDNVSVRVHFQIGYSFPREIKGDIKIVNLENNSDQAMIPVVLTVARSKISIPSLLVMLEHHQYLFPFLQNLLNNLGQ
jgi:hypothetical protein